MCLTFVKNVYIIILLYLYLYDDCFLLDVYKNFRIEKIIMLNLYTE